MSAVPRPGPGAGLGGSRRRSARSVLGNPILCPPCPLLTGTRSPLAPRAPAGAPRSRHGSNRLGAGGAGPEPRAAPAVPGWERLPGPGAGRGSGRGSGRGAAFRRRGAAGGVLPPPSPVPVNGAPVRAMGSAGPGRPELPPPALLAAASVNLPPLLQ